jgi:hypothetical protein
MQAAQPNVGARVATVTIQPGQVTVLHLRPEFESSIRMPEEVSSIVLGSPGSFKAEHNAGEPQYVYVKPITKQPAQSNLLIATKSGQHVTLELVSDGAGAGNKDAPVDFLLEYRASRSFFVSTDVPVASPKPREQPNNAFDHVPPAGSLSSSAVDEEFAIQSRVNAPSWTKWDGKQIETSIGDIRQWNNEMAIAYSVFNASSEPVEIVPPQIQITGLKSTKKKKAKGIISDQLEIRDFRLSGTRLEPGARVDGVVEFDRPNFKQSTEKLFLQIAQADQVDHPILIRLPFTPPLTDDQQKPKGERP